jgi:hypothetical protein
MVLTLHKLARQHECANCILHVTRISKRRLLNAVSTQTHFMIIKIIIWFYISHMSLINEHKIIWGYNISRKDLLIYVIASQALLSVLQIIQYTT